MRKPVNRIRLHYAALERHEARHRSRRSRVELETVFLPVDPCESEFGAEALEQVVFDDDLYGALSMAVHGQRLWDSAEEQEVDE